MKFTAHTVIVPDDDGLDYGEGWLGFEWPDPLFGDEGLTIMLDGHCSRLMPFRCGQGPPEFIDLKRKWIRLRFASALAKQLELAEEVEIEFALSDQNFRRLQKTIEYFNEVDWKRTYKT